MRRAISALGFCLALTVPSRGRADEDPPARQVTLADALAYAHAHQPDLRAAEARVAVARAAEDASRARWYPTIEGVGEILSTTTNNTTGSYLGVAGFDNPRVSATRADSAASASLVPAPSTLLGVGVRQEVFDFGRISSEVAVDAARLDVARLSSIGERLAVDYRVEEAYFAVYAARSVVEAAASATVRARKHRDEARMGLEAGLRRPIELARAEAVLDRYELARLRASRDVFLAESALAVAVGAPDRRLDISGAPGDTPDAPSLDEALATAAQKNPDLQAAVRRVFVEQKATRVVATTERPNLILSGALSGNAGGASPSSGDSAEAHGLVPLVPNWDVGLVLAWPIFDETANKRVLEGERREETARHEAEAVRQRLFGAVTSAFYELRTAKDALPLLRRAVDAAVANYEQASARFDAGLGNSIELADAEDLRVSAEIDLAEGEFGVARARAALGRLVAEAS